MLRKNATYLSGRPMVQGGDRESSSQLRFVPRNSAMFTVVE